MRILIAGCGDVGCELGRRLAADEHTVWGLRRRSEALPPEIQPLIADLRRPDTLRDLPPQLDAVVYTAAADGRSEEAYRAAYVDGLGNFLAALANQGQVPARLIFVSSTAVYGQDDGSWVDESSPTEPTRFSGKILLQAERLALQGPCPATVVRLAGIYGPGRRRLVNQVASGQAELEPEGEPSYTNRIHREDCAGALHHLLSRHLRDESLEPVYLGVDNEPTSRREVLSWIAERLGMPQPPEAAASAATQRRGGNKRCSNRRLLDAGYRLSYPSFRDGYGAMLT